MLGLFSRCRKRHFSLVRKFYGIVRQVLQSCAQAQTIARRHRRQIVGYFDVGLEILIVGTRRESRADSLGKRTWCKRLIAKNEAMGLRAPGKAGSAR